MSVAAELSSASFRLMTREPFYGHAFSGVLRVETEAVPSITVSLAAGQTLRLQVNPTWWRAEARDPERQMALLKHQILHIVLGHVLREREFLHRALFWIAADLVVNQYIHERGLRPDDITLGRLASLGLPPGEGVGTYYDLLLQAVARGGPGGEGEPDGPPSAGQDELQRILREGHPALEQHIGWRQLTDQTAAERRIVEHAIDESIRRSVRRAPPQTTSRLPGPIRRRIEQALATEPAVDWRRVLALFAGASRRTVLRNTLRRPSKRYGTTPGLKVRRRHRVVVAVDTSGSMTDALIARVFAEIHHLHRHGAQITVVECDAAVQATWTYRGTPPTAVGGGGGTRFDPAIEWANLLPERPDALIYLTDGYAPTPTARPRMPTLWIITPGGVAPGSAGWQALPGRRVKLPATFDMPSSDAMGAIR